MHLFAFLFLLKFKRDLPNARFYGETSTQIKKTPWKSNTDDIREHTAITSTLKGSNNKYAGLNVEGLILHFIFFTAAFKRIKFLFDIHVPFIPFS